MEKELLEYIVKNKLSPFVSGESSYVSRDFCKTRDAKSIYLKVMNKISTHFVFSSSSKLLDFFDFSDDFSKIKFRQEFFSKIKSLPKQDNSFLKKITLPKSSWRPRYEVVVVTENPETFNKLRALGCPSKLLLSETDLALLESCDVIQALDCDEFSAALSHLEQVVFIKSLDQAYLERYLEDLSGWKNNLLVLQQNLVDSSLNNLVSELLDLLELTSEKEEEVLSLDYAEEIVEKLNSTLFEHIKKLSISGEDLFQIIRKGVFPEEIKIIIREIVKSSPLSESFLNLNIPIELDRESFDKFIKQKNSREFSKVSERIKSKSALIKEIPKKILELSNRLILLDFVYGVSKFLNSDMLFPEYSTTLKVVNSKNLFLDNPQAINFELGGNFRCSILTGANSGGKTTLLEHLLQIIFIANLGFPVSGQVQLPFFKEIYYFAKNKGSANKGAFETLLNQMSQITPGNKTLILADEIEAVTEPGVAGKIISATVNYYIDRSCFLVIATHLGSEIAKILPKFTRIDGIEAKGLTEQFDLIVDHNPVLGRLAHSTPELIVEKLANSKKKEYYVFINDFLKTIK